MMFGRRRGHRRGFGGGMRGGGFGMMLLAMQLVHLFQYLSSSNEYFPITLGVLGLNLIAFFQPGRNWPSIREACISVRGAWFDRQWKRVFLASFYHSSDFHLYYNMASFIWKAISLEKHFGSVYFLYMIAIFSVTTNLLYVAINYALAEVLDQWSYINSCAVGFSGVLFALKVVTTHLHPAGMTRVMGFIPVPMRIACWVELVLISVLFPHVSFIGHLAGILVGFAFVYGPLRVIMDIPLSLLTGTLRYAELVDLEGVLSEQYRRAAIVAVGVFMILFPLLLDLVPSGTGAGGHQNAPTDGRSYTYRAGATGHRGGAEQRPRDQPHPPRQDSTTRPHQSYTYASGSSGHESSHDAVPPETTEEAGLQEAIHRSLSEQGEGGSGQGDGGQGDGGQGDGGEGEGRSDLHSDQDLQVAIERSMLRRREGSTSPPDDAVPPPFNPNFPPEGSESATMPQEPSHSPSVGWNRDILEPPDRSDLHTSRPLGFDVQPSDPDSTPRAHPSGNGGMEIRQRRNQTQARPAHEPVPQSADRGASASLTREAVRAARLQRLEGREGERKPLSELASHSFSFKK